MHRKESSRCCTCSMPGNLFVEDDVVNGSKPEQTAQTGVILEHSVVLQSVEVESTSSNREQRKDQGQEEVLFKDDVTNGSKPE